MIPQHHRFGKSHLILLKVESKFYGLKFVRLNVESAREKWKITSEIQDN